jgi:hypothetical protein
MGRRKGNRGDKEGGGQLAWLVIEPESSGLWSADRGSGHRKTLMHPLDVMRSVR